METGFTFTKGESTSMVNTGIMLTLSWKFEREDLLLPQANRLIEILGCVGSVHIRNGRIT